MSPYRVCVKFGISDKLHVLCAMLSSHNDPHEPDYIYIVNKHGTEVPGQLSLFDVSLSEEDLAYSMTTKHNSTILGKYEPSYVEKENRYQIYYCYKDRKVSLPRHMRTLSKCLEYAMEHYCNSHDLEIVKIL